MTRVAIWLATVLGLGYFPFASGTVGSAAALVIYYFTCAWPWPGQIALIVVITAVGTWAASVTAAYYKREDPGLVVIDEVAGQLVTLALTGVHWRGILAGFLIFRVLDIIKPYPANRFERLHGGVGIMADDVMAGVYGNIILRLLIRFVPIGW